MSPCHRQTELNAGSKHRACSPTENALITVTQRLNGVTRLGEVLHLQGPYISLEQLKVAIARLQRRHPALRSRLQAHPTKRNCFMFEEDAEMQLPVKEIPRKRDEHANFWTQEWPKYEKDPINIGDPFARLWLFQDPADKEDPNGFREIVFMCEHAICDAQSLSNAAHELLQILSDETGHAYEQPLSWGETMENAIRNTLSGFGRMMAMIRFIPLVFKQITNRLPVARMPFGEIDFDIREMEKHCHTEAVYGVLNKEMTTKLLAVCRREGVTVTSAVTSAILSTMANLVPVNDTQDMIMFITLSADVRRRCIPPVPNHDLNYYASGIGPFSVRMSAVPKTPEGLWQLAQNYSQHTNACVNAGQILACGMVTAKAYQMMLRPMNTSYMPTYNTSSWGVSPFVEQYGPWQLTGVTPFMNLLRSAVPMTIIQTVNGVLTLMFGGASPLIPSSSFTALRDRCMNTLQQMINN